MCQAQASLSLQLQKRKEREEQLEDVIQAYEKIHMEKSNLQRDLDKMVRGIIQFTALCISVSSFFSLLFFLSTGTFTQEPYGPLINSYSFTL